MKSFAIFALLLLIFANDVFACSCSPAPKPLAAMENADIVVAGTIIGYDAPSYYPQIISGDTVLVISTGDMVKWDIVLTHVWKGSFRDTTVIYSRRDNGACGFHFKVGEQYIIYGSILKEKPSYAKKHYVTVWPKSTIFPAIYTSFCDRTRMLSQAEEDLHELPEPIWVNE